MRSRLLVASAAALIGASPAANLQTPNDIVAKAVTIAAIFLGTRIVVSVITIKISDMVLDSRIGHGVVAGLISPKWRDVDRD